MCRSVYLSGLLMSHGTDSVRTRRATIEKKNHRGTMKHCGRLKLKQHSPNSLKKIRGKFFITACFSCENEQTALS